MWLNITCKVIAAYERKLTGNDWEQFAELMRKADFWGLKISNGANGLDGSTLVTTGFKRGSGTYDGRPKFNYVHRWGYSTLNEPFHFVLKLSGNTQGCLVVN